MVSFHCPLCCDQPFEDQQALFFHLRGLRNNLFCPICSEKFSALELLITHLSKKCQGTQLPSEAKRRCLSEISLSDKIDLVDEFNTIEKQPPKTQLSDVRSSSQMPFEIPSRLLKNVSISIKETGEKTQNQSFGAKNVKTKVIPVDPKNPIITNGLSQQPVKNVTAEIPEKNKEEGHSNANASSTNDIVSNCLDTSNKANIIEQTDNSTKTNLNIMKIGESDVVCQDEMKTTKVASTHIADTTSSIIQREECPEEKKEIKRKRGRPRKNEKLHFSNGAVTANGANKKISPENNGQSNGLKDVPEKSPSRTNRGNEINKNFSSVPPLDHGNDDNHFEESMKQNESQAVDKVSSKNKIPEQKAKTDIVNKKGSSEGEDVTQGEEDEEYTCSACDVRFTSIYEHIKQFHNGEEVVVEVPEEEIKEDLKAYQNESDLKKVDAAELCETTLDDKTDVIPAELEKCTDGSTHNEKQKTEEFCQENLSTSKKSCSTSLKHEEINENCNNFNQTNTLLIKSLTGKWFCTRGVNGRCYHYITDKNKMVKLLDEFKFNYKVHPDFKVPNKQLFESPELSVIAITNKLNTPVFTYAKVDFKKPIPMYVVVRQSSEPHSLLGGIASYVIRDPCGSYITEDTKVIVVMKVVLGSDQMLTVENIMFDKPAVEGMVPVLENITEPEIPLLEGGKILKWKCTSCMSTDWKLPINKDSHLCNGCLICHKTFATSISLKKHMLIHKKNITNYCETCHLAFATSKVLENHQAEHDKHALCSTCNLFVPLHQDESHKQMHSRMPVNQFPCSVCHKVFASDKEVKVHESKTCGGLEAKYSCSLCDKKFFSVTALSYHTADHKSVNIKFPCNFCRKTYIKENEEERPRKGRKRKPSSYIQKIWHERFHKQHRPFFCHACSKKFRSWDHQLIHSSSAHYSLNHKDVRIHKCSECHKLFRNAHTLEKHKKEHYIL